MKNKIHSMAIKQSWKDPEIRARRAAAMSKGALNRWADEAKKAEFLAHRHEILKRSQTDRNAFTKETFAEVGIPPDLIDSDRLYERNLARLLFKRNRPAYDQIASEIGASSVASCHVTYAVGWALSHNKYPAIFNAAASGARWYWCKNGNGSNK